MSARVSCADSQPADLDDFVIHTPDEYKLEELGPWSFQDPCEGYMSGAPQFKNGQYVGDLALYNVREKTYVDFRSPSYGNVMFAGQHPSTAGKPNDDTLSWWLELHGGYDKVVKNIIDPEGKGPVRLRWDTDEVCKADVLWDRPDLGGWWMLYHWDRDTRSWEIYINEHGEEGVPER